MKGPVHRLTMAALLALGASCGDGGRIARPVSERVEIVEVTPAILAPGIVATARGTGFSSTSTDNVVTVDGTPAVVTGATPTSVTFTVPATLACEPTHDGVVRVAFGDAYGVLPHPVQAARQRALAVGQELIITDAAEARCNEFAAPASQYYVAVFNTSRVFSVTGASYMLRGAAATGAGATTAAASVEQPVLDLRRGAALSQPLPVDEGERLRSRILEENLRILRERSGEFGQLLARRSLREAPARALAVGDQQTVRIPDINGSFCSKYFEITARVAYVGARTLILEDLANPLVSQIDTTWQQIGQEFDDVLFGILSDNIGDPLITDPVTDANGKIVMVFSRVFNDNFPGLAGFIVTCDFFPRGATSNQSSNFGEYFYARVPTNAGTIFDTNTPPRWKWSMRSTIIHEVKHITAFGTRISASRPIESSWLEESTARVAEELYERQRYGFAQGGNVGYGSSADPRGPWCGVRACNGNPRGIARIFEELNLFWFRTPELYSPLGRRSGGDFSFYNTGWSLVRWAMDHSPMAEPDFLKAIIGGPETGIANLEARTGRSFDVMLPEWALGMVLDDQPAVVLTNGRLRQPGWNLRDMMVGLGSESFVNNPYTQTPFSPESRAFGDFSVIGQVVPGTAQFVTIGGVQSAGQLLELRSDASNAAAPAELRIAVVRIQ